MFQAGASRTDYNLTCKIHGTWRDTLLPVNYDEVFRVVAAGQTTLYYARGSSVFTTGAPSPSATIDKILVERAEPVVRESKSIDVSYQLIDEIADQIRDSAIVTGSLIVAPLDEEQRKEDYVQVSEEFPTIKIIPRDQTSMEIQITYCPAERFKRALFDRGIFVLQGTLTVTSEHRK